MGICLPRANRTYKKNQPEKASSNEVHYQIAPVPEKVEVPKQIINSKEERLDSPKRVEKTHEEKVAYFEGQQTRLNAYLNSLSEADKKAMEGDMSSRYERSRGALLKVEEELEKLKNDNQTK